MGTHLILIIALLIIYIYIYYDMPIMICLHHEGEIPEGS